MEWTLSGLRNEGYTIEVILLFHPQRKSHFEEFLKTHHFSFTRLSLSGKWKMVFVFIRLWRMLRQLQKQHGELVVHTHGYVPSFLGITAARWAGISRRIITRHHGDYHQRYGHTFHARIDRWLNQQASTIIALSPWMKSYLVNQESVPAEKICHIPHGFDLSFFQSPDHAEMEKLNAAINPNGAYPVIGVVARWMEYKGIHYIIPAFKRLLADYPDAILILAHADGSYESAILELLAQLPQQSYYRLNFTPHVVELYA
jgi:glycosyltransferase involved in cell wall biosynthesis